MNSAVLTLDELASALEQCSTRGVWAPADLLPLLDVQIVVLEWADGQARIAPHKRRGAVAAGGKNDWETPWAFIRGVETWFGAFSLDVCAEPHTAKAPWFYTKDDDGLIQSWDGRWWCNPEWGAGLIAPWVDKAVEEIRDPDSRGCMLLPHKSEQPFWGLIEEHADVILEVEGRQQFVGATSGVTTPTVLIVWDRDLGLQPRRGRISRDGLIVRWGAR